MSTTTTTATTIPRPVTTIRTIIIERAKKTKSYIEIFERNVNLIAFDIPQEYDDKWWLLAFVLKL